MSLFFTRLSSRSLVSFGLFALAAISACSDSTTSPQIDGMLAKRPRSAPVDTATTTPSTGSTSGAFSALVGALLYVDPYSNARKTADAWRLTRPADATQMDKIATQSQARWFGNWNTSIASDIDAAVTTMTAAGAVPVLVAYNIPQRDCGGLSGGNTTTIDQYKTWISAFANGIRARRAVVILEPDALAGMDCLSTADQQTRLSLVAYGVAAFKALGSTAVYLDGGHAHWQSATTIASRLNAAGVADAAGFALNVSNFVTNAANLSFGQQVSPLVGGKHYVIDSSRNGLGPTADNQWCNPAGRALGTRPTTTTGIAGLDAFLWVKAPGESDGACNGGPSAGVFWADYALGLAQRAV
jgi:endoglucanase